jgi:hypothetical protein
VKLARPRRVGTSCVATALLVCGLATITLSAQAPTVQELRVGWQSLSGNAEVFVEGQPPAAAFTTLDRRRAPGALTPRRSLDLSSDQIVISGLNASGVEIYRNVMADPRILRSEAPGPTGELTGQVLFRARTEFLIDLPDDPAITAVTLYHPRWTGTAFALDVIVSIKIP